MADWVKFAAQRELSRPLPPSRELAIRAAQASIDKRRQFAAPAGRGPWPTRETMRKSAVNLGVSQLDCRRLARQSGTFIPAERAPVYAVARAGRSSFRAALI